MTDTVTLELDRRFRDAAAAAGLLDVGFDVIESPVGPLLVAATERGLARIFFDAEPEAQLDRLARTYGPRVLRSSASVDAVHRQLDEYFEGKRSDFTLDVDLRGTAPFARHVLEELSQRPVRADDHVRHARRPGRRAPCGPGGGHRDEPQSDPDRAPLPPRRRRERQPHGLRRRAAREGAPAPPRGRAALVCPRKSRIARANPRRARSLKASASRPRLLAPCPARRIRVAP